MLFCYSFLWLIYKTAAKTFPRLFREEADHEDDQAQLTEKEPLTAQALFGEKRPRKRFRGCFGKSRVTETT